MGDDAPQESQYAQVTPRTAEMREFVAALVRREVQAERERQAQIGEILTGGPLTPPRKPKRDRHGMHIVRGFAAVAAAGLGWLVASRGRRLAASAATVALVTGGTLSPDMIEQAPAAQLPAVHHHVARHHRRDLDALAPVVPVQRKRRRHRHAAVAGGAAPPRPGASHHAAPSPRPSPVPSVTPFPLPSIPVPLPSPTCLRLTGHHCHDDGLVGDARNVLGALGGFTG